MTGFVKTATPRLQGRRDEGRVGIAGEEADGQAGEMRRAARRPGSAPSRPGHDEVERAPRRSAWSGPGRARPRASSWRRSASHGGPATSRASWSDFWVVVHDQDPCAGFHVRPPRVLLPTARILAHALPRGKGRVDSTGLDGSAREARKAGRRPRPSGDPPRPPRLFPSRSPPSAHGDRRGRHPLPLPDVRLVQGASAHPAVGSTAGTRARTSVIPCCSTTSPCRSWSCRPWLRSSACPWRSSSGRRCGVFLLPLLAYAAFRLMGFRFPAPLLGAAGRGARVPLPRGQPDLGRDDREHADRRVLVHLRNRLSPFSSSACAIAPTPAAAGRWGRRLLLGLTALAHGYAVLWAGLATTYFLVRLATALAHPRAPGVSRGRGLRYRGDPARAPALRLGLDDARTATPGSR